MTPKREPAEAAPKVANYKDTKPHQHRMLAESHTLLCLFRTNHAEAKKYCGDLKFTEQTGPDEIMLAMLDELGGAMHMLREEPQDEWTHTERGASMYELKVKVGRPCKERVLPVPLSTASWRGDGATSRRRRLRCSATRWQ